MIRWINQDVDVVNEMVRFGRRLPHRLHSDEDFLLHKNCFFRGPRDSFSDLSFLTFCWMCLWLTPSHHHPKKDGAAGIVVTRREWYRHKAPFFGNANVHFRSELSRKILGPSIVRKFTPEHQIWNTWPKNVYRIIKMTTSSGLKTSSTEFTFETAILQITRWNNKPS